MRTVLALLIACLLAAPALARAQDGPPEWDRLDAAQREQLIAIVRERWNNAPPAQRARMLKHAQRWAEMTPEQRHRAHRGAQRWAEMTPEQRRAARALFERGRTLPPEQRKALMQRWRAMTPEQRRAWLQQQAPAKDGAP